MGIATLADFLPEDAHTYWSTIGLKVLPNRITQVHVDGGGELSSDAGSGETSLDVEQSGGLAPGAKISQATGGGRLGLWNPMLYRFKQNYGYRKDSPFIDIAAGDNWFYHGIPGYEPGAGLGVLDVTKLAIAVARDHQPGPPHSNAP